MAGLINWKKVAIPGSNPDIDHVYVGIDIVDGLLYIKDSNGIISKTVTNTFVGSAISSALSSYDLSTIVDSKINNAVIALINSSPSTLDTLNELALALGDDPNFASTTATSLGNRLRVDTDNQSLSPIQKTNAKTNIDLQNVNNTSDINKPISTANQNALDLKYNASNPNGYEIPSQLNSRDINNRNRSNHTGTQLSTTISNFSTSVLSTVLSGISFLVSTPVLATDTILVAIGKLQQQINLIPQPSVFGTGFENFKSTNIFNTSASYANPAVVVTFTTTSKLAGEYRVAIKWNFTTTTISSSQRFYLYVDGIQVDEFIELEGKDTTDDIVLTQWGYVTLTSGIHTIDLRAATESINVITIKLVRSEIWRVS